MPRSTPRYSAEMSALKKRDELTAKYRSHVQQIEEMLSENPKRHPGRLKRLSRYLFCYTHPEPRLKVTFKQDARGLTFTDYEEQAWTPSLFFVSYARRNTDQLKNTLNRLRGLELEGWAEFWTDRAIESACVWNDVLEEKLATARSALLLVSQAFLESEFIMHIELPRILQRARDDGLKIFWIQLDKCSVPEQIARIQSLMPPDHDMPLEEMTPEVAQEAWRYIENKLREHLVGVGAPARAGRPPEPPAPALDAEAPVANGEPASKIEAAPETVSSPPRIPRLARARAWVGRICQVFGR